MFTTVWKFQAVFQMTVPFYIGQQCIGWKSYYLSFFKLFFQKFSWWLLMVIWVSCQFILSCWLQTKIIGWIAFGLVTILILASLREDFLPMDIQFIVIFQCVFNLYFLMAKHTGIPFLHFFVMCVFSSVKHKISFAHPMMRLLYFLTIELESSSYVLDG